MMRRKILSELIEWKGRRHKCLVVKGQRQVGKTYILEHFGSTEYDNYVILDLNKEPFARDLFEQCNSVDEIIDAISLYKAATINPRSTLIILDEIQESTRARSMLKAFSDDGRYDVVATGSLLGVSDARLGSFKNKANRDLLPVGSEEHLLMHSMDFEEFLWATGIEQKAIDRVRDRIRAGEQLNSVDLEVFSRRFRAFMVVGGMPDAVNAFVSEGMSGAQKALDGIVSTCINDINRYNSGTDVIKTMQCFESIPYQLSETNKRFTYSRIDNGGSRSSGEKYRENLLWIENAGYGNFSRSLKGLRLPLKRFSENDVFKVYMSDSGILMHMLGPESKSAVIGGDTSYDMGAVSENIVAECLMKLGYPLYYYRRTNGPDKMELDLVIDCGGITVVEVKTGANRDYPSLRKTLDDDDVDRRIVFEKGNVRIDEDGIEHYPLFAAAFLLERRTDDIDGSLMEGMVGNPYPPDHDG